MFRQRYIAHALKRVASTHTHRPQRTKRNPMATQSLPDEWYYLDGTKPVGPFTRDVMRQLRNVGMITRAFGLRSHWTGAE